MAELKNFAPKNLSQALCDGLTGVNPRSRIFQESEIGRTLNSVGEILFFDELKLTRLKKLPKAIKLEVFNEIKFRLDDNISCNELIPACCDMIEKVFSSDDEQLAANDN